MRRQPIWYHGLNDIFCGGKNLQNWSEIMTSRALYRTMGDATPSYVAHLPTGISTISKAWPDLQMTAAAKLAMLADNAKHETLE